MLFLEDPGDCGICGAAHCACTPDGVVTVSQLPQRDAALRDLPTEIARSAPSLADQVQAELPPGAFTTGTYRGKKKGRA